MKTTSKISLPPKLFCPPPLKKLPEILLTTSHLDRHTTTDVKPDMLSGVQTGNGIPHDRFNIHGMRAQTERQHFHAKTTRANFTSILEWGQKSRPYPARAYTTLVVLVFSSWEPHFLGHYLAWDSVIHRQAGALWILIVDQLYTGIN